VTIINTTSNVYDLFYRNYDPVLGRMNQVDPMATKYASITPYNFAFSNPVYFNDESGADPYSPSAKEYYEDSQADMYGDLWRDRMRTLGRVGDDDLFPKVGAGTTSSSMSDTGPQVYNKWCNCNVDALDVLKQNSENQNAEFRQKAIDATLKYYSDKINEVVNPVGLIVDGVSLTTLDDGGITLKMQSGQKLVFYEKRVIKEIIKSGAASKAITFGNVIGKLGTGFAIAGIGVTVIQVAAGDKHWAHGVADSTMGIIGILVPGAGTVVSIFYFAMTSAGTDPSISSSFIDTGLIPIDNVYVVPNYPKID